GPLGIRDLEASFPEHVKRLGTCYLVNHVQPDKKLGLSRGQTGHRVGVPDFVVEGILCHLGLLGRMLTMQQTIPGGNVLVKDIVSIGSIAPGYTIAKKRRRPVRAAAQCKTRDSGCLRSPRSVGEQPPALLSLPLSGRPG